MDTEVEIKVIMGEGSEPTIGGTAELYPVVPDLENPMPVDVLPNALFTTRKRAVYVDRDVLTANDLVKTYSTSTSANNEELSLRAKFLETAKNCCSGFSLLTLLFSLLPVLSWLPKYNIRVDAVRDLSAGLTLGIIQIPQGMAYGMLTTLPAIYGLYASLIPVFVYFAFGTSKHLNMGTFAIICLMVGEVVDSNVGPLVPTLSQTANGTSVEKQVIDLRIKYAVTVSFLVGVLQVAFGFLRFGFITILLSDALISGFTTGAAFHIFSSQVKHLVGMKIPRKEVGGVFGLFKLYIYIFKNITQVNYGSLIIGLVAAPMLYAIKFYAQKYKEKLKGIPIPAELIVVILGTGLSYGFDFNSKFGIPVLQDVPTGMPPMTVPSFSMMASASMIIDCLTIGIVSYAISISIAKAFAKKNKYPIDSNQELFAHGASNIVSGFFSCTVASGSLSRSLIQENLGSSQLCTIFSCVLIILVLTVLAPWFEPLPNSILAAIVLIALKGLFRQFSVVKKLIKVGKVDAFVWISSFIAVICLGVDYGLAIGLVINLLSTIVRTSRPSAAVLAQVKDTEIYTSLSPSNDESLRKIPGVGIFQFHAPLLYINVDHFQEAVFKATVNPTTCVSAAIPKCFQPKDQTTLANGTEDGGIEGKRPGSLDSPHGVKRELSEADAPTLAASDCPLHTIVLDCSQISYADTMGTGALVLLCSEFKNVGVDVLLCNTPAQLLRALELGGFIEMHGSDDIFVSVHDAVQFSLSKQHLEGICEPGTKQDDV